MHKSQISSIHLHASAKKVIKMMNHRIVQLNHGIYEKNKGKSDAYICRRETHIEKLSSASILSYSKALRRNRTREGTRIRRFCEVLQAPSGRN